jgi:hypothetical protein
MDGAGVSVPFGVRVVDISETSPADMCGASARGASMLGGSRCGGSSVGGSIAAAALASESNARPISNERRILDSIGIR